MILFSFGLFFNARMLSPTGPGATMQSPYLSAPRGRLLLPEMSPAHESLDPRASLEAIRGGRKILETTEPPSPLPLGSQGDVRMPSSRFEPSPVHLDTSDILIKSRRNNDDDKLDNDFDRDEQVASAQLHRVNKSDERALDATREASSGSLHWGGQSKERLLATVETAPSGQPLSSFTSNPNKTLFLCPSLTPISVPALQGKDDADGRRGTNEALSPAGELTLLLPASAAKELLPSSAKSGGWLPKGWPPAHTNNDNDNDKAMLRLSCRLLDARPVSLDEITSPERPLLAM